MYKIQNKVYNSYKNYTYMSKTEVSISSNPEPRTKLVYSLYMVVRSLFVITYVTISAGVFLFYGETQFPYGSASNCSL